MPVAKDYLGNLSSDSDSDNEFEKAVERDHFRGGNIWKRGVGTHGDFVSTTESSYMGRNTEDTKCMNRQCIFFKNLLCSMIQYLTDNSLYMMI